MLLLFHIIDVSSPTSTIVAYQATPWVHSETMWLRAFNPHFVEGIFFIFSIFITRSLKNWLFSSLCRESSFFRRDGVLSITCDRLPGLEPVDDLNVD